MLVEGGQGDAEVLVRLNAAGHQSQAGTKAIEGLGGLAKIEQGGAEVIVSGAVVGLMSDDPLERTGGVVTASQGGEGQSEVVPDRRGGGCQPQRLLISEDGILKLPRIAKGVSEL